MVIGIVEGNRDFFLDAPELAAEIDWSARVVRIRSGERRYRLVHGDLVNRRDFQYRFWSTISKSAVARLWAGLLPRPAAVAIVRRMEAHLATTNRKFRYTKPIADLETKRRRWRGPKGSGRCSGGTSTSPWMCSEGDREALIIPAWLENRSSVLVARGRRMAVGGRQSLRPRQLILDDESKAGSTAANRRGIDDPAAICPDRWPDLAGAVELPASKSLTNRALIASAAAGGGPDRPATGLRRHPGAGSRPRHGAVGTFDWEDGHRIRRRRFRPKRSGWTSETPAPGHVWCSDCWPPAPGDRWWTGAPGSANDRWRRCCGRSRPSERPCTSRTTGSRSRWKGPKLEGGTVAIRPRGVLSVRFVSAAGRASDAQGNRARGGGTRCRPLPISTSRWTSCRPSAAEVSASADRRRWSVAPAALAAVTYEVEGDWSAAAFFLAAAAISGGAVDIGPLDPESRQGDREAVRGAGRCRPRVRVERRTG